MRLVYGYDNALPSRETDTEQLVNTVAALSRRGLDVELLVAAQPDGYRTSADEVRDYYQVDGPFRLSSYAALDTRSRNLQKVVYAARATSAARHMGADLFYTRNLSVLAAALSRGYRVAYEHFRPWGDQYPPLQPMLRQLLTHRGLAGAILHSEHALRSYLSLGVPRERLLVAHNGYDPRRMEPRLDRAEARRAVGVPQDAHVVTYAGRINEKKGLDMALEMARLRPDMTLLLVGSEGEGPVEQAARALPNVRVYPWQPFDRTVPYLYAADVLLIPPSLSPLEQHGSTVLPMKLFLYLAAGRPILAPRAPDTAELLVDGDNAVLVTPGDEAAAVAALDRLFGAPDEAEAIGRRARERSAELTWDARAARIAGFLQARRALAPARAPFDASAGWSVGGWALASGRWLARNARR